jgi:hypothetical protein
MLPVPVVILPVALTSPAVLILPPVMLPAADTAAPVVILPLAVMVPLPNALLTTRLERLPSCVKLLIVTLLLNVLKVKSAALELTEIPES